MVNQFLPGLQGKAVLDVGCGAGYFCMETLKRGAARVVGVDISEAMLTQARRHCPSAEYVCSDKANLTPDVGTFDVIICALVLGHSKDSHVALEKLNAFLKAEGVLILTDFHPALTQRNSKRTFLDAATGKTFEIKHYLHALPDVIGWLNRAQLSIEQLEEPVWKNRAVIYAIRARKK